MSGRHTTWLGVVIAALIVIGSWSDRVAAHPHVFLETSLTIIFDRHGLKGIGVRWRFDPMFTAMITQEFDRNRDRRFNASEIKTIRRRAFSNLRHFGYFTPISVDGRKVAVTSVRKFKASLVRGRLIYAFYIPCRIPVGSRPNLIVIGQYDPTFYTRVSFSRVALRFINARGFLVKSLLARNPNKSFYYGLVHPLEASLTVRRKGG
jgi:ABC-type uncharacterized transport system substrate-binding protein